MLSVKKDSACMLVGLFVLQHNHFLDVFATEVVILVRVVIRHYCRIVGDSTIEEVGIFSENLHPIAFNLIN